MPLDAVEWRENPIVPMDAIRIRAGCPHTMTEDTLLNGDVDVLITPRIPRSFDRGDPRIGRLFPDHVEQSVAYYKTTGIFPIMHVLTIRGENRPRTSPGSPKASTPRSKLAKRIGYERMSDPRSDPTGLFRSGLGGPARTARARSLGVWAQRRKPPQPRDGHPLHAGARADQPRAARIGAVHRTRLRGTDSGAAAREPPRALRGRPRRR